MTPTDVLDNGNVTLYRGDCLDVLRAMPDGVVDCVITDPPYQSLDVEVSTGTTTRLVRRDKFGCKRLAAADGPKWFETMTDEKIREVLAECERVVKPDGAIYVFADVKTGLRIFADDWPRNVIVWDKGKIGMGYGWRRMHEWIGYRPMPRHKLRDLSLGDIIRVAGVDDKEHPTEKPVGVVRPLVRNSTDPGAVVLDPFMGSGSTLRAAMREGRKAWGVELDPAHYETARRRLVAATGGGVGQLFAGVV
jgi:site-specific DNA-methyltransferase (adenine-specific)